MLQNQKNHELDKTKAMTGSVNIYAGTSKQNDDLSIYRKELTIIAITRQQTLLLEWSLL